MRIIWYNAREMKNFKVCVALPTSKYHQRQMVEGVVAYVREFGPWRLFLATEDDIERGLVQARAWGAEGVIAMGTDRRVVGRIFRWGVPAVLFNCEARNQPQNAVYLQRDQGRIGRTAAEYYLERGYRNFAFVNGVGDSGWARRREEGFVRRVRSGGFATQVHDGGDLGGFLAALPNQTALFAVNDRTAQTVLGTCLEAGITVPERLAVLGVDDDRIVCEAMTPQLSSISLDGVQSGRLAAQLLSELLAGRRANPVLKIDFPRVVTRQSTDANVIADIVLSRTLAELSADFSRPQKLVDIAARLGYSKRTLELKARKVFGCTFTEKLNSMRLNEAVRMLSNTALTVDEVAHRCGFCGASHLGLKMKAAFGYPPSVFRH